MTINPIQDTADIKRAMDNGDMLEAGRKYWIASRVVVQPGNALVGPGSMLTTIQATKNAPPDTGISVSENINYDQIPRRPKIGGFLLNGYHVADNMLFCGYGTLHQFEDISVTACNGIGLIVNELQNSTFRNVHSFANEQGNLLIDNMSRTLTFTNSKFSFSNGFGIRIQQSDTGVNTNNMGITKLIRFDQPLIEAEAGGHTWSMEKGVEIIGGTDIVFFTINTSACGVFVDDAIQNVDRISFLSGEISNPGGIALSIIGHVTYQFTALTNIRDGSIYIDSRSHNLDGFVKGPKATQTL